MLGAERYPISKGICNYSRPNVGLNMKEVDGEK
jgi:hypothetical protein